MNTDIRIAVSFLGHRKRRKLKLILGAGATDCLLDLWIQTAMNHPDGLLSGMDEVDIALEAGWDGDPKQFVEALVQTGFLDKTAEGYRLHDWEEHQPWVVKADERVAKAKHAAGVRWAKDKQSEEHAHPMPEECKVDAPSMPSACQPESPTPFLSSPCLSSSALSQVHKDLDLSKSSSPEPKQVRSEPEQRKPPSALVGTLPLNDGSDFEIRQDLVDELSRLFPAVDVKQSFREMKSWILANPAKRKTKRGVRKFIHGWLSRDQDKGGNRGLKSEPPKSDLSHIKWEE